MGKDNRDNWDENGADKGKAVGLLPYRVEILEGRQFLDGVEHDVIVHDDGRICIVDSVPMEERAQLAVDAVMEDLGIRRE